MQAAYLALTFLTAVPLLVPPAVVQRYWGGEAWSPSAFARAAGYYPLAGYVVGGAAAAALALAAPLPGAVAAALTLAVWLALTGWLHLDGLLDSADALLAACPPQRRLNIMRDVHIGAFGFGVGGCYLLLLHSLLAAGVPWYAPIVAAVWARALVLVPMRALPNARVTSQPPQASAQASLGGQARASMGWGRALLGLGLAAPTLLWPLAWAGALAGAAATLLAAQWAARRLGGGLTGDVYGLLIASGEVAALLAFAALLA